MAGEERVQSKHLFEHLQLTGQYDEQVLYLCFIVAAELNFDFFSFVVSVSRNHFCMVMLMMNNFICL